MSFIHVIYQLLEDLKIPPLKLLTLRHLVTSYPIPSSFLPIVLLPSFSPSSSPSSLPPPSPPLLPVPSFSSPHPSSLLLPFSLPLSLPSILFFLLLTFYPPSPLLIFPPPYFYSFLFSPHVQICGCCCCWNTV